MSIANDNELHVIGCVIQFMTDFANFFQQVFPKKIIIDLEFASCMHHFWVYVAKFMPCPSALLESHTHPKCVQNMGKNGSQYFLTLADCI